MIKRLLAAAMLVAGIAGLWPLMYGGWAVLTEPADRTSLGDIIHVWSLAIVAVGAALVVGGAWLFSTTRGRRQ